MHRQIRKDTKSLDPHIWLSPLLVEKISLNIANALIKEDAKHKKIYEENLKNFLSDIKNLHKYGIERLKDIKHREFIVFHPVWGYFAKEFNLKKIAIEIEGKSPKPNTLVKLISYAKQKDIKVIFVQPEFSKKSAEVIAKSIGAKVVTLDPLSENWHECIKKAIDTFAEVLK
jgi:zinc transport system substrate-binding protein